MPRNPQLLTLVEPTRQRVTIPVARVVALYHERNPAGHWFDRDTMRFFKTRLPRTAVLLPASGAIYFITAETDPQRQTRYTVRCMTRDGHISTQGGFHCWRTRAQAVSALNESIAHALATVDVALAALPKGATP